VRAGLVNLGWQPRDADLAIAAVEPELLADAASASASAAGTSAAAGRGQDVDVAVALRAALRVLGRG
jgi:hypothetical protein